MSWEIHFELVDTDGHKLELEASSSGSEVAILNAYEGDFPECAMVAIELCREDAERLIATLQQLLPNIAGRERAVQRQQEYNDAMAEMRRVAHQHVTGVHIDCKPQHCEAAGR